MKKPNAFKEAIRKMIVNLKRQPQMIPMISMAIAFIVYSFNLTAVSNTTAKIQGAGMGFCGFCTMLFSMLSFVCFLNAFPVRKKVNVPMLVLMLAMFGIVIGADLFYGMAISNALTRPENPIVLSKTTIYIAEAYNMINNHITWLLITLALIVLLPVYSKLLRKIKTSVDVEDNGAMAAIELSE